MVFTGGCLEEAINEVGLCIEQRQTGRVRRVAKKRPRGGRKKKEGKRERNILTEREACNSHLYHVICQSMNMMPCSLFCVCLLCV